MEKKQYLSEYEIESIACLPEGLDELLLSHPQKIYQIKISNKQADIGEEKAVLRVLLIYAADSLDNALKIGKEYIKEFADYLTFGTSIGFKVRRLLKVVDWTKGVEDRDCYILNRFPGDDRPYPVISEDILGSIETILEAELSPILKRALRWYSRGVSSQYLDDQYQCFWFSMELLASIYKGTKKVNDLCAKCRSPLFCEHCGTHPTHRPYSKQAIQHLFQLMIRENADLIFDTLNEIRNALMHGDDVGLIEKNKNITFSEYVDKLGGIVWVSIFNTIMSSYKERKKVHLNLLETNTYCLKALTMHTRIVYRSKDPDDPKIEEIPNIEVSAIYEPIAKKDE